VAPTTQPPFVNYAQAQLQAPKDVPLIEETQHRN